MEINSPVMAVTIIAEWKKDSFVQAETLTTQINVMKSAEIGGI